MKDIKDYLHLYLGCEVLWENPEGTTGGTEILDGHLVESSKYVKTVLKPILRRLSSMTEEEAWEIWRCVDGPHYRHVTNPKHAIENGSLSISTREWANITRQLLSKHFDLFNLIDEGIALDASTLQNKNV